MSKRRVAPPPGASYVDVNRGIIMHLEDDVKGIKSRIEEAWPVLEVLVDVENEEFVIVQNTPDGTQHLVFATKELDERTIERCHRAQDPSIDLEEEIDRHNAAIEKEKDYQFSQKLGDAGERLLHALAKDGLGGIPQIAIGDTPLKAHIEPSSDKDSTDPVRV